MEEEYTNSVALTKSTIDELRNKIITLKNAINAHIGEGGSLHPVASEKNDGFMSKEDYKILNTNLEDLYQKTTSSILSSKIPSGTTCWYYGNPADLPSGWKLTSSNSLNSLYKITTKENGGSIRGVLTKTEKPGTEESVSGKESIKNRINTIALYSIRKD